MDIVREHFEEEAREFDRIIQTLIPYYDQMLEALIAALPFASSDSFVALDLGCGTGTISQHLLEAFPQASVTGLDFAERMIEMARIKLSGYPRAQFLVKDFRDFDFAGGCDVVVSSLALHHLNTDDDKRQFYRRVYRALRPGGCFYNADVVLGSGERLQSVYLGKWKQFMRQRISEEEIEQTWLPKYRAEDRPACLVDQLEWLTAIGFTEVDVLWKYYNYAVYGGVKTAARLPVEENLPDLR